MQLIQLLKSPVTVAVLAVFHDLAIVPLAAGDGFPWILYVFFWGKIHGAMPLKADLRRNISKNINIFIYLFIYIYMSTLCRKFKMLMGFIMILVFVFF